MFFVVSTSTSVGLDGFDQRIPMMPCFEEKHTCGAAGRWVYLPLIDRHLPTFILEGLRADRGDDLMLAP